VGEARPWRFPIAFGDEELHAIAHADEAVIVLRGDRRPSHGAAYEAP
jgi:hypothetical protein